MPRLNARTTVTLLAASALAACSLAPKYVRPQLPVPPSWPVGDAYLRQSEAPLPTVTYRDVFRDQRLQGIIDQALVNNRDLRVAVANIEATRAQYRIQRADLLPQLDATGSYSYRRTGSSGVSTGVPIGTGGGNAGTGGTGTGGHASRERQDVLARGLEGAQIVAADHRDRYRHALQIFAAALGVDGDLLQAVLTRRRCGGVDRRGRGRLHRLRRRGCG